jgi:predicted RNase H-like HicB family nuclease
MVKQEIHAVIFKDAGSDQWVAMCLEYDVVTQADNASHAREMIKEAVDLYLGDADPKDLEVLYQEIEGDVIVDTVTVDAPTLLHR